MKHTYMQESPEKDTSTCHSKAVFGRGVELPSIVCSGVYHDTTRDEQLECERWKGVASCHLRIAPTASSFPTH